MELYLHFLTKPQGVEIEKFTYSCAPVMQAVPHALLLFRKVVTVERPPLWSSGQSFWLQIQRSRVRFPALPDFLSSSGSGTGSTQPRESN